MVSSDKQELLEDARVQKNRDKYKYLGFMLDKELSFKLHVASLIHKN